MARELGARAAPSATVGGLMLRQGLSASFGWVRPERSRRAAPAGALAARAALGEQVEPAGIARLPRPSGHPDLLAFARPLRPADCLPFGHDAGAATVALFISDPRRSEPPAAAIPAQASALTAAEARPAAALAGGATLRDYAEAAGIRYETARWHLKRIYDKTDTRRQSELIALLLRTRAALAGGESS